MPLKIQCADNNVESVKEIASTISKLIQNEKKLNVPFLTSTLIAYLKSMEDVSNKDKILQETLNKKLLYESRIQELQNENHNLKSISNFFCILLKFFFKAVLPDLPTTSPITKKFIKNRFFALSKCNQLFDQNFVESLC